MGRGLSAQQQYIMTALGLANALTVYEVAELLWKRKFHLKNEEPPVTTSFSDRSTREIRRISSAYRMMTSLVRRGLVAFCIVVREKRMMPGRLKEHRLTST
jgi:hypothetical protein